MRLRLLTVLILLLSFLAFLAPTMADNQHKYDYLIGQTIGQSTTNDGKLITEEYLKSLESSVRVIGPDMAVTMDYREDRVNFSYDETKKITRISWS